jgi:hypothetical protein
MVNLRFPWVTVYFLAKCANVSFSSLCSILVGMVAVIRRSAARWGRSSEPVQPLFFSVLLTDLEPYLTRYTAAALTLETPRKPPKLLRAGRPVFLRGCSEVRGFTQSSPVVGGLVLRCVPLLLPAICILKHSLLVIWRRTVWAARSVWLRHTPSVLTFPNFGCLAIERIHVLHMVLATAIVSLCSNWVVFVGLRVFCIIESFFSVK